MLLSCVDISSSPNRALDTQEKVLAFWDEGWLKYEGKWFESLNLDLSDRDRVLEIMQGDYVIGANLYDGPKNIEHWVGCRTIQIDFDGTLPAQEALARLDELGCDYVLRYSRSHGTGKKGVADRYHVLVPLNKLVDSPEDHDLFEHWTEAVFGFTDKSVANKAQCLFRGSKDYPPVVVNGRGSLTVGTVLKVAKAWKRKQSNVKLTEKAKDVASRVRSGDKVAKVDGHHWIELDQEIELKDGRVVTAGWILDHWEEGPRNGSGEINWEVKCIVCGDDEAIRGANAGACNAHIFKPKASEYGAPALQCSSCESRGMGAGGAGFYNFRKEGLLNWSQKRDDWFWFYNRRNGDALTHAYRDADEGAMQFVGSHMAAYKNDHKAHGVWPAEIIPAYDLKLVFDSDELLIADRRIVNKYDPPAVLGVDADASVCVDDFGCINTLVRWALGEGCAGEGGEGEFEEVVAWHYDWLAWIVQHRRKVKTSWLLHGTEGTGKGMFYNYVVEPIFGRDYCSEIKQERLSNNFNKLIGESIFCLVDEAKMDMSKDADKTSSAIKTLVTQDYMTIEPKGVDAYKAKVVANLYFFSNEVDAVRINKSDRRFNVGFRQELGLDQCPGLNGEDPDVWKDRLENELSVFVAWLKARRVGDDVVSKNLKNSAWRKLCGVGMVGKTGFWSAIRDGNVDWFEFRVEESDRTGGVNMGAVMDMVRDELPNGYLNCSAVLALYNHIFVMDNERAVPYLRMRSDQVDLGESLGVVRKTVKCGENKTTKAYTKG